MTGRAEQAPVVEEVEAPGAQPRQREVGRHRLPRGTEEAVGEREETDKSPEATEKADGGVKASTGRPGQRAEVSNLDIVRHYFDKAAEHLGLPDDLRVVFWTPYREVTVQIPVKLSDGKTLPYKAERAIAAIGHPHLKVAVFDDRPINKPHGLNVGLRASSHEVVTIFDPEPMCDPRARPVRPDQPPSAQLLASAAAPDGDRPAVVSAARILERHEITVDAAESAEAAIDYLTEAESPVPVTYADVWEFWLRNRDLASAVDFVTIHILPYWEGVNAQDATGFAWRQYDAIRSQYKGIERKYIIHDASAKEVDEETFYHTRESGGTRISSAYKTAADLIDHSFPVDDWNIYCFQFSDGDNWGDDIPKCIEILTKAGYPSAPGDGGFCELVFFLKEALHGADEVSPAALTKNQPARRMSCEMLTPARTGTLTVALRRPSHTTRTSDVLRGGSQQANTLYGPNGQASGKQAGRGLVIG